MTICNFQGCTIFACFGLKNEKPKFCKKHSKEDMIDLHNENKKCIICKLNRANYNYPNEKKALYCKKHSNDNMIDVSHKKCIKCNKKRSNFNYPNEKKALYCFDCKLEDMIDVSHKKCIKCNKKRSNFNYPNEKKALYCFDCKLEDMIDVDNPKFSCESCGLTYRKYNKNQKLCSYCNPTKRIKTKEETVRKLLEKHSFIFIHDTSFKNDCCLKYRPDFLFDCKTYFVILEVDEFAHCRYEKDCEITRMNNVSVGLGLPTKFIRYNPDNKNYTTKQKQKKLLETLYYWLYLELCIDISPIYLFY
ncbi:MAG TPA: hypothetical protein V6C58_20255 [Allocoleopsis sp.]